MMANYTMPLRGNRLLVGNDTMLLRTHGIICAAPDGGGRCKTAGCACYTTAKTGKADFAAALRQTGSKRLAAVL